MHLTLPVTSCVSATPRAKVVKLALAGATFAFHAGQAALLGLAGQSIRRPYSMASAPADVMSRGELEFLVQRNSQGSLGPHLAGLRRGSLVTVEGPVGVLRLPDRPRHAHYLFVAGGSGIAPLRSMMHHLLSQPVVPRISIAYSARTSGEFAFAPELRRLARSGVVRLLLTTTREIKAQGRGRRGRLTSADLRALGAGPDTRGYVCGPESLVRDAPSLLVDAGLVPEHVYMERW